MVRKLTNMLAYLDERLGKHSGTGPEYHFYCPACITRLGDESGKRKLGINLAKGKGGCFRCSFGFQSFTQLFRYLNGGYIRMEEFALLRHEVNLPKSNLPSAVRLHFARKKHLALKPFPLPPEFVRLADLSEEERSAFRYRVPFAYLKSRGIGEDKISLYNIGYCATGEYAQRLIFPVIQNNRVVYWTNRFCGDHPLKSKNPPNTEGHHHRGTCLLNYDLCLCFPSVALVEGPISAIAFHQAALNAACAGDPDAKLDLLTPALAMMGKFLSGEQRKLIAEMVPLGLKEIVVALDPGAGAPADEIYSSLLGVVPKVTMLVLENGDPDDVRDSLPQLLRGRREPSVLDRVRQRLNG
jgi:hypothetical protein